MVRKKPSKGIRSIEALSHFRCGKCDKWWSVGDAPQASRLWFCPWCGTKQAMKTLDIRR